MNVGLLANSLA